MRSCIPVAKVTSGAIKCSPTDFPEPGLSLHQPWAHVVLHLHCQPYTEARGREGPGRAGAGHVGCAAAILRGGGSPDSPLSVGPRPQSPRVDPGPSQAARPRSGLLPAESARALPSVLLGHRRPKSNSWAGPRDSALETVHMHQQPQE